MTDIPNTPSCSTLPSISRYFDYMMLYCKPVFLCAFRFTFHGLNQLLEPFTFGQWLRGPLGLADQPRHCQGWNIARKHVALVPCLIGVWVVTCCLCSTQLWWYRPWDLSLGGARGVGGNPNMWVCYYVRSTSRAQICVCYILLMYIFGRITSTYSSFFTTCSITEINSFGSAKSPMNSTLQQTGCLQSVC